MSFAAHLSTDADCPVDAERMLRAVALGGQRGRRTWRGAGAAIGVADGCAFATAPGGRAALFDGQLHNRAELIALVGGGEAAGFDDARLLLAVHERRGDDTARAVIGDYAFAIWDGTQARALLAVDPGGMRPLVLHARGDALLIASEAAGLFATGRIDRTLDEGRVAEWLAILSPAAEDSTFFVGVQRVPPGGRAIWANGRLTIDRWWDPLALPMLQLPRHADYAEAVGAALDEAVACRIDPGARIGSHLSGGLDSATVTALAARRMATDGRVLTAYTAVPAHAVPDAPGRFGDEWPHAAAVAARYPNIDHLAAGNADMALVDLLDLREPAQDVPVFNVHNSVWNNAIERDARDRGITVMLTGQCGNMSFSYDGSTLARVLMRRGQVVRAVRETLAMRRVQGWRWRAVAGHLADAGLPAGWGDRLRQLIGRRVIRAEDYTAIDAGFAARAGVADRLRQQAGDMRNQHPDDSRALRLAVLRRGDVQGEFANGARRLYGIDTRDPTMDRRLVELCLAIPDDQFLHHGLPRAIARTLTADCCHRWSATSSARGCSRPTGRTVPPPISPASRPTSRACAKGGRHPAGSTSTASVARSTGSTTRRPTRSNGPRSPARWPPGGSFAGSRAPTGERSAALACTLSGRASGGGGGVRDAGRRVVDRPLPAVPSYRRIRPPSGDRRAARRSRSRRRPGRLGGRRRRTACPIPRGVHRTRPGGTVDAAPPRRRDNLTLWSGQAGRRPDRACMGALGQLRRRRMRRKRGFPRDGGVHADRPPPPLTPAGRTAGLSQNATG